MRRSNPGETISKLKMYLSMLVQLSVIAEEKLWNNH